MPKLFEPFALRDVTLPNRIAVSPMCEYSSEDGFANAWHLVHLGSRAVGGAGLVMTEATAVTPDGRITPGDLGIYRDEHVAKLAEIVDFIHGQGAVSGIQLAHAGRKASCAVPWQGGKAIEPREGGWRPIVAPSALPFEEDGIVPHALAPAEIADLVAAFATAAGRAVRAGFRIIEIHAAHGYLIHEFLSPLSNRRDDAYGGDLAGRARFLYEIVAAIRAVIPAGMPLLTRISASDWVPNGWDIDDSVALARELKARGVDAVDCSSGGLSPKQTIALGPGYQVPFAQRIRHEAGVPTGAVGLIETAAQAEEIVAEGRADFVLLARQFLRDPYFALHAATELGMDVEWPVQYLRAKPKPVAV